MSKYHIVGNFMSRLICVKSKIIHKYRSTKKKHNCVFIFYLRLFSEYQRSCAGPERGAGSPELCSYSKQAAFVEAFEPTMALDRLHLLHTVKSVINC